MAIDTSGDIPDKVIADMPHGASAPGGALTRRPSETVKTYHGLSSLLPGRGEAAGGVHFIHYDGTSYAGGRRKGADEPYAADKWTESIDLADITDDSMRLYLMEISRVNLLTKKQEQTLARQIEEWKHLEAVETELEALTDGSLDAWMCVLHLIRRIGQLGPIVDAVCRYHAMRISETLTDVLIDEELSERIDGVLPEEMLLFAAEILNREPEDVKQGLIELSLAIRLLPTEAADVFATSPAIRELQDLELAPGSIEALKSYEPVYSRHFASVRNAGRRAQLHLSEANLRLVVSIAKKVSRQGDAAIGPHSGGQYRSDAWRAEVRLPQGLQVQHLRHLVDSTGGQQIHSGPVPHHPRTRAYDGDRQQAESCQPPVCTGIRARPHR